MSRAARSARTPSSPITPVATGIARSARARRPRNGWPSARPSCCRCRTIHVVFTLPAADRRHRLSEQGRDLRSAVQGFGRDADHDRGRPQAPRRTRRRLVRPAYLGLGAHPPSARAHDRAGRRHLARRQSWVSCRPGFFLPVRVLSRLFRRLFLEKLVAAHRGRRAAVLRQSCPAGRCASLRNLDGISIPSTFAVLRL